MLKRRSFALALVALALPACSSSPAPGDTESVGSSAEPLVVCNKQGCCVGSSLAFDTSDPLQAQLAAWGCTSPKLYSADQASNAWWYYSQCPDPNQTVEKFLSTHASLTAAPDSATVLTAPMCAPTPPKGSVDVLFDPTCPTCRAK
jgi:hypothetical protein